ncbi:Glycosyl transferases group 1 [Butyrivibrio hungatei DSM 14810]|uniref:Glycosyl transferases group 1 n=1 Tax=Butyrivibrio hungatei DSM 14810 TaxID=1121132 RepID=A0A1M7SE31_9FIRM|nr:glycosyltransferase [Butyrivibrio hungatei]SHN56749.1 Glycosyl transferases group 1 [Butyrivibrio hungatei DSM 14810]
MKRLLLINSVIGFGSTGRIVLDIAKEYEADGYEAKIAYGRNMKVSSHLEKDVKKYGVRIGKDMDVYYHVLYTRLTDRHGLASKMATKKFLKWASEYDPDVLWMHNIHGYYINYEMLFDWIKSRPQMEVKWTLHDCWTFTGHCSHFAYVGCEKWRCEGTDGQSECSEKSGQEAQGCMNCPQLAQYPQSKADNSRDNYRRKKAAFTGVKNLTIITPSKWLKENVEKSYLCGYPVEVKYNTVDTDVFKPVESTFKKDNGIENKKMILGVASLWNDRKGLKDFYKLSEMLDKDKFQIVLVGLSKDQVDEISEKKLNIIGLERTSSVEELKKIYSAADVFANPTYEDTFPTVNMEAEACGTPVITYDTGGCKETIKSQDSKVIPQNVEALRNAICDM